MSRHPAGTVAWARDPTNGHDQRPVVVLAHEHHPFGAYQCSVMCLGTGAADYDNAIDPVEITDQHIDGFSLSETTYVLPWALYTIAPGAINTGRSVGQLTSAGEKLIKKQFLKLFAV